MDSLSDRGLLDGQQQAPAGPGHRGLLEIGARQRLPGAGSLAILPLHRSQSRRTRALLQAGRELCGQPRQTVNAQGPYRKMAQPLTTERYLRSLGMAVGSSEVVETLGRLEKGDFQGDKK